VYIYIATCFGFHKNIISIVKYVNEDYHVQNKTILFHLASASASQNNACCGAEIRGKQQSKIFISVINQFDAQNFCFACARNM